MEYSLKMSDLKPTGVVKALRSEIDRLTQEVRFLKGASADAEWDRKLLQERIDELVSAGSALNKNLESMVATNVWKLVDKDALAAWRSAFSKVKKQ